MFFKTATRLVFLLYRVMVTIFISSFQSAVNSFFLLAVFLKGVLAHATVAKHFYCSSFGIFLCEQTGSGQ